MQIPFCWLQCASAQSLYGCCLRSTYSFMDDIEVNIFQHIFYIILISVYAGNELKVFFILFYTIFLTCICTLARKQHYALFNIVCVIRWACGEWHFATSAPLSACKVYFKHRNTHRGHSKLWSLRGELIQVFKC